MHLIYRCRRRSLFAFICISVVHVSVTCSNSRRSLLIHFIVPPPHLVLSSPLSRSSPLIWWWMKNRSIFWYKEDEALTWSGGVEQSWKSTTYRETQVLSNLIVSVAVEMMKMNILGLLFVYFITDDDCVAWKVQVP